jgi:hypothetical protein
MFSFVFHATDLLTDDSKLVLYGFIVFYGVQMMIDFIASGVYRKTSMGVLMFQPYMRIFIQQFVVILGSMFLQFGAGKIFMLIFVAFKIYFEIFINFDYLLEKARKQQEAEREKLTKPR